MKRMSAILLTSVVLMSSHAQAQSVSVEPMQAPKATKYDTRYSSTDSKIVVFDDGQQTYVSLPKEMQTPIVISFVPAGEVLLQPAQMSPYLLLPGLHKKLKFVWGNARDAYVTHTGDSRLDRIGQPASFGAVTPVAVHGAVQKPVSSEIKAQTVIETSASKAPSPIEEKAASHANKKSESSSTSGVVPVVVEAEKSPLATYKLDAPETVRTALQRWATQANWVFGSEFYSVPSDVSVVVSADLGTDFKSAVRQLLESTQGTAQPMQPCFYANQVLRVVARHELCARY